MTARRVPRRCRRKHAVLAYTACALVGCLFAACDVSPHRAAGEGTLAGEVLGTVRYEPVEGGCWWIDLGRRRVEPIGLPTEFRRDGLTVAVRLEDAPDLASTCQVGELKKIASIRRP